MPAFSCCLRFILARPEWSGVKLAKACGVDKAQITRWKSGAAHPARQELGRLAAALPKDAAGLVAAWVADILPQESRLITILPRTNFDSIHDDEAPYRDELLGNAPQEMRDLLTQLGHLSMENDAILTILQQLHKFALRREMETIEEEWNREE